MSIYENSVVIKNITRIYGTFKYRFDFDGFVKVRDYLNNKNKNIKHFVFKFNPNSTLNQIYTVFYNIFRLRDIEFSKDIKKTIIVCLDYYKLVDLDKKEFSFNSLIGKDFTSCRRTYCYNYNKKENKNVVSNKDKIALDYKITKKDRLYLLKLLEKFDNDLNYIAKAKKIWKIFRSGVKESLDSKNKEENNKVESFKKILYDCVNGTCKEYPKFPVLSKRAMIIAFIELLAEERKLFNSKLEQERKHNEYKLNELRNEISSLKREVKSLREENVAINKEVKLLRKENVAIKKEVKSLREDY